MRKDRKNVPAADAVADPTAQRDREIQARYYAETAHVYDEMHVNETGEHALSLCLLLGALDFLYAESVLDIGSGTGRAIGQIKRRRPDIRVMGIEPVKELREVAYAHGIGRDELIEGDATRLEFTKGEFDVVCEFGALHHIRRPELAVAEMLRVARKAIFISDSNNFGQGRPAVRAIKQLLNLAGLWKIADFVKTKGRGYTITAGDGLAYSYSVFNDYELVKEQCSAVHVMNTCPAGISPYRTSAHVALLGIKKFGHSD